MWFNSDMSVLISLCLSFIIVYATIPSVVSIAHLKQIYDQSEHRKRYNRNIPNLGGISLFMGLIAGTGLFTNIYETKELLIMIVAMVLLFFAGLNKDINPLANKIYSEILSAIIIVIFADIRITSLHGFLGIFEISYIPGLVITSLMVTVLINSFTMIDGVDGLASGIGIIASLTFGIWFYLAGHTNYAILSAALLGSLLASFCFNVFGSKNKILTGNSGLLVTGLVVSVLMIKFNEYNITYNGPFSISSAPAVSLGILIIPVFDSLRVFLVRLINRKPLFGPDNNYLYNRVLELGFSQITSTIGLLVVNIVFIFLVLTCQTAGINFLTMLNLSLAVFLLIIVEIVLQRRRRYI